MFRFFVFLHHTIFFFSRCMNKFWVSCCCWYWLFVQRWRQQVPRLHRRQSTTLCQQVTAAASRRSRSHTPHWIIWTVTLTAASKMASTSLHLLVVIIKITNWISYRNILHKSVEVSHTWAFTFNFYRMLMLSYSLHTWCLTITILKWCVLDHRSVFN